MIQYFAISEHDCPLCEAVKAVVNAKPERTQVHVLPVCTHKAFLMPALCSISKKTRHPCKRLSEKPHSS